MDHIAIAEITFLKENIDEKTMNGIDVGCGARKTLSHAIGVDVARMEETDFSAGATTEAEWVGNGHELPFKDNTLDYVLSRHVLEHMDWQLALQEWMRCLKTKGIMRIVVPDPNHPHHIGHGLNAQEVANFLLTLNAQSIKTESLCNAYSWGLACTK